MKRKLITLPIWLWLKRALAKPDLTHAEWRRLEYRQELATREGEKMNPYGIR